MCRVPAQGKSLALLSSVPCFLHVNPPLFEWLFVGNIDHFINKMRHLGPEGCVRLIDVFQGKAADKVFQEGCWFSGLFLPTGLTFSYMLSLLLRGDPPTLCWSGEGLCHHPKTNETWDVWRSRGHPLTPTAPALTCFHSHHGSCVARSGVGIADLGENFIVIPPFFFSLMLVATTLRDKGKYCAPCPKVTLATSGHRALSGPW